MTSLITVRYPNDTSVDDLLWPAVTPGLLIRLEPGEVLRWRGRAHVAEDRYAEPQVLHADYERVWNLLGPADCLITDRRITYRGDRGNTLQWSGGMSAAVAPSLREPRGDSHWGMPMGQVRFQWPLNVVVQRQVQAAVIGVTCINGGMPLRITLTMIDTQTSRAWLGDVAGDVASGLARDIARFRLLAQAGQLTPEEVRQLTLLRDGPMLAVGGSSLGWELPGGLPVGQAATPGLAPVVPARPTVPDGFRAAVEAFSAARSPQELGRAVEQHPVLLSEDIDAVLVGQLDWLRSRHSVDLVRQLTTWHEALRDWRKPGVSLDTTHDPYKEWRNKRDQEAWRNKRKQEASLPVVVKPVAPVVEDGAAARAVDQALALLAGVVGDRCRAEERAHGLQDPWPLPVRWMRSTLPVADQQPAILDEPSSDRTVGRSGQLDELLDVLAQVPSGRLLVLGGIGAGKTMLSLLLAVGLLDRRQPSDPVPIPLSLASWDPHRQSFSDWIIDRVAKDYPGLPAQPGSEATSVRQLLASGRLLPVLNDLPEIPQPLPATALAVLNDSLSSVVLICGRAEYGDAVTAGGALTRAEVVELCPLGPEDVTTWLRAAATPNAVGKWDPLFTTLRDEPTGPLAAALSTPLMARLARTVYADAAADPGELLYRDGAGARLLPTRAAVENHLLDRLIPAAYTEPSAPADASRQWTSDDATHWLSFLAVHLDRLETRELAWWRLYRAVPSLVRGLTLQLGAGLVYGLVFGLVFGLLAGQTDGLVFGLVFGLSIGVLGWPGGFVYDRQGRSGSVSGGLIAFLAICVMFGGIIETVAKQRGVGVALALLIVLPAVWIDGPRVLLVLGPVFGVGFAVGMWPDLQVGFFMGIILGVIALLATLSVIIDLQSVPRPSRVETRLEGTAKPFLKRFATGQLFVVVPTAIIFAASLADHALASVAICLTLSVAAGLATASTVWLDVPSDASSMATPSITLRLDRAAAWTSAIVIGFLIGAACWLSGILFLRLINARLFPTDNLVKAGIASAITLGITVLASRSWGGFFLTRVWLALTGRLPWRVMGFLADAHRRGILHQTGAVYQFTHGRLQDRLVANAKHANR